jgi:hypothetical protein
MWLVAVGAFVASSFDAPVAQRPTLLRFVEAVSEAKSLDAASMNTLVMDKLVHTRSAPTINRTDFEARDVPLADGSIRLVDLRQVGPNAILVLNIGSGCLTLNDVRERFHVGRYPAPNKTDAPDGLSWHGTAPLSDVYFDVPDGSKCIRTIAFHSGL